jgi:hypothetical protein
MWDESYLRGRESLSVVRTWDLRSSDSISSFTTSQKGNRRRFASL